VSRRFYERQLGVYFDDLDPFGILHNARYLFLFERTLGEFWQHIGFGGFQEKPDVYHFVRANTAEYLAPVIGTGRVRVRVFVETLGRTSLTFGFKVMPLDSDTEHARGTRTIVHVDSETWRPKVWSDKTRAIMAPWLDGDPS